MMKRLVYSKIAMKQLYIGAEIREIETRCREDFLLDEELLIEHAGRSCWELFAARSKVSDATVILAGGGNNAADALALARQAHAAGKDALCVVLCTKRRKVHCERQLDRCRKLGIDICDIDSEESTRYLRDAIWIIDGICGVGLSQALRPSYQGLIDTLSTLPAEIFAIDVPSGAYEGFRKGNRVVHARYTAQTGARKALCYDPLLRPHCGELLFAQAAFPRAALSDAAVFLLEEQDRALSLPLPESHKYTRGQVAVCAGSPLSPGAALLSATASLYSLAGLVKIYTDAVLSFESQPSLMRGEGESYLDADVVVAGPGWGLSEAQREVLGRLLRSELPLVLDADALTLLAEDEQLGISRGNMVLTPHPGEAARLCRCSSLQVLEDANAVAMRLSEKYQALVLLKSHVPRIALPDGRLFLIDGMNPALSTAGSGDVLAGIVGGLLASGHDMERATLNALMVHQRAGALMRTQLGFGTSSDMLSFLPQIISLDMDSV